MGEVYEAEHRVLRRRYALKLLPEDFATRTDAVRRFEREAEVMAILEHPHIVRVDEFGQTERRYWLRMELVHGVETEVVTLGQYAVKKGGKFEEGEFAVILKQILEGLAYAHAKGVVHRDLKPGNILLEKDPAGDIQIKVSDFGLARVIGEEFIRNQAQVSVSRSMGEAKLEMSLGDEATKEEGTSTRALLGTWEYMSPEQRRSEAADSRSDVYAVGLICYRLLTGQELGRKAVSEFGSNPAWDEFVDKALNQTAAARYANGGEMLAAFAKCEGAVNKGKPAYPRNLPDIGEYEILEVIGHGGMGVVYKARQRSNQRIVALKTILGGEHADEDFKSRFRREARLASKLNHPNIVPVLDIGEHDGQPYFCMKYVPGTNLAQKTVNQPLRPEEAARYVEAMARAVQYAHEHGVLHRDIKPSNILVDADDCPKVTDFGLARQMNSESGLTSSGAILGTPGYLPPEQLSAGSGEIGPTSDVYGLGAVLYHLLTGRPPYLSSTAADTLKQLQETEPVPPRQLNMAVPHNLQAICLRCLRKKQRQRYQTALELAEDLQRYLQNQPILSQFDGELESDAEAPHQSIWRLLLFLGLATLAGAVWLQQNKLNQPTPVPVHPNPTIKPIVSVTNISVVEHTSPPPPADSGSYGWLGVHILKNSLSHGWPGPIHCKIQGVNQTLETNLAGNDNQFRMRIGNYSVTLTHSAEPNWNLVGPPAKINGNETNTLNFTFIYETLRVESDPPGALVNWLSWATPANPRQTNHFTPFAIRFRSGAIPLTARSRRYYDTCSTNYFYPNSDSKSNLPFTIHLTPKPVPFAWMPWTNSLGMVFRWLESQHLWTCEIETRVGDYRVFTEDKNESHYDPRIRMFSVTSNGWKQLGYSWNNPGPDFSQNEDYPVIGVSWTDATNFCDWLTRCEQKAGRLDTNQQYRLPTTSEWFALAGGRRFPWGNELPPKGNYAGIEVLASDWPASWPVLTNHQDHYPRTAPVYAPEFGTNELGFYGLGGNAAEWCQEQVLCGGSWFDGESEDLDHLEKTVFEPAAPNERQDRNGFRVFLQDLALLKASQTGSP
jgi:serine/threonine protein kinase